MRFNIGDVLTMTTGCMLCPIENMYKIANFLTGDNLYTHALPRAFKVCQPWINTQYPELPLGESGINRENWKEKLAEFTAQFGEYRDLKPLPEGIWDSQDPIQELINMVGPDKVIVVEHD